MKTYSIVIVENHILLSQAIATLINTFDDFRVLYTCVNGQELLTRLDDDWSKPDIILMDINMPVLNGIETTKLLKIKYPKINVIALSVEENEATVKSMLKAGACGYLLKDIGKETLEKALIAVINNGYYYTKNVSNIVSKLLQYNSNQSNTELKERELEFIKHVCSELTYKEIADKMYLSPKTIDGYRSHLFDKLNAKNKVGLVLYAIKNKIFTP
jgi:DNA-binding NarL/FixJ family response regulator